MSKPFRWKRKHKRFLLEILVGIGLFAAVFILVRVHILPEKRWLQIVAYLLPYAIVGWRVVWKAARNISRGQVFDENFLMTLATVGAFVIGDYPEAVFVMLFYRVGELFEEIAVGKSRASIASLMEIRPDVAHVERDGETVTVDPAEVAIGEIIVISPGERVPLDGIIRTGTTTLDTSALTGESLPRDAVEGDNIISGCVNLTGLLRVEVTRAFGESTVSKILELVENAGEHKSKSEHFITRFAQYYTPAVVIAAVLLAVVPPVVFARGDIAVWREWLTRAMSFLVISCPCALVISVPLSFFGGIGGASRRGILIKGSGYLEALATCDTVVFDKTGTLTEGHFSVVSVIPAGGFDEAEVRGLAAAAEAHSTHPIARALANAVSTADTADVLLEPIDIHEIAGRGVIATIPAADGTPRRVAVGNAHLMQDEGAGHVVPPDTTTTVVYVSVDGQFAGQLVVADTVKTDTPEALASLRACGVKRLVMLTGDSDAVGRTVAAQLGLDDYHASLLPADKVARVESLLAAPDRHGKLAFVGDGINDAPVLARADIGIAMGALGSDAAIEAADIVLMDDRMASLPTAIQLSRRTLRIVRQNIIFALSVKAIVLFLSAIGLAPLSFAIFADVGVAVLAILNAMRALGTGTGNGRNGETEKRRNGRTLKGLF